MDEDTYKILLEKLKKTKVAIRNQSTYDNKLPKGRYSEIKNRIASDKLELLKFAQGIYQQGNEKYYYIELTDD